MTARNPGLTLSQCSEEFMNDGRNVLITHGDAEDVEIWVHDLKVISGQPVDWVYMGGRAVVLTLGDAPLVLEAALWLPRRKHGGVPEFYRSCILEGPYGV